MTEIHPAGPAVVTFHGPVKIYERRTVAGVTEYVVTPLSGTETLERLAEDRERLAWYAGVQAALRRVEELAVEAHPLTLGRLRDALMALRAPQDPGHD